jgi:hypothetical protein
MARSSYASLCLGLRISSYLVHSVVCTPRSSGKLKKTREEATAFLLLPPPGTNTRSSAIPARPLRAAREGLGTARFTKPLEMKKRRSARCPRVAALVQLHPPRRPCNDTQEIAKSFWSNSYGGLS